MSYRPLVFVSQNGSSNNNVMYRTIRISTLPTYEIAHEIVTRMFASHDIENDIVPVDYRMIKSDAKLAYHRTWHLKIGPPSLRPLNARPVHLWLTFANELTMFRFIRCMPYYFMCVPHLHSREKFQQYRQRAQTLGVNIFNIDMIYAYENKHGQAFMTRRQRLIDALHHALPSLNRYNSDGTYSAITVTCARCQVCQRGSLIELITSYYPIQY
jgi:hypothetical protein